MARPPHQHDLETAPLAKPDPALALAETDLGGDPWGLGQSPEGAGSPKSTHDIREVYLKRRSEATSSAGVSVTDTSRLTIASRVWAGVRSRFPFDRRIVAGLGLVGVACVLLVVLSRYDVAPAIKTMSGTTYNTAVERLASAVGAALDLVGPHPAAPVTTAEVASISRKKVPNVRPTTGKRGPLDSSRALQLTPLISTEAVQEIGPAPIGSADVNATLETGSEEAPAVPQDDSAVDTSIIYSPNDVDVSPPVAIRSPGIATDRSNGDTNVSFVEILVSETGQVESARGRRRPATLGGALQSTTALSVVKTWRFRPALKNSQPVKYRTTVPFVEAVNHAGRIDAAR